MLKCDVLDKVKDSGIKFEDLPVGSTFVVKSGDEGNFYEWIGMKCICMYNDVPTAYALDLSGCVGELFDDVDMYNIVRLIDLKVVEDEGDE